MKSLLFCLLSVCISAAYAQAPDPGPIATDRPSASDGPYIVPKGYLVIETGYQYQINSASSPTMALWQLPAATIRYPLSERFELRLGLEGDLQYEHGKRKTTRQMGLAPAGIGFKVALSENKGWMPKTAFLLNMAVPKAASRGFRATYMAPTLKLAMQNSFGESWTLDYNIGAAFDGETATPTYFYTTNLGYVISDRWACFAEVYGDLPSTHSVDAGVTFVAWYNILLDLSAGYGLTPSADDFFVGTGFSVRFPPK